MNQTVGDVSFTDAREIFVVSKRDKNFKRVLDSEATNGLRFSKAESGEELLLTSVMLRKISYKAAFNSFQRLFFFVRGLY